MNRRHALKLGAGTALAAGLVPGFTAAQETTEEETTQAGTTTAGEDVPASVFLAGATGGQQSPPVETAAGGSASFAYDPANSSLFYALLVSNIENVNQAHIHRGAPGENGEVVVWLYPGPDEQSPTLQEGRFDGLLQRGEITDEHLVGPLEGESLDSLLSLMADGEAYVNVHTEQNPGGEIRGQIVTLDTAVSALGLEGAATATEETETEVATEAETETAEETPEATTESG